MKTEIVRISPEEPEADKIRFCADVIRSGGLVAFPTETVYGLGANAFDDAAVRRIFEAKNRPADNPLIVHIARYSMLETVAWLQDSRIRQIFLRLGRRFWPGPLTMIVEKTGRIPASVSCGLDTVGLRMPDNRIAYALIDASGVPIAAPSANRSGRPSPTRFSHVLEDLDGRVDVIIDGGACKVGVESTVLDLTCPRPTVLRPGAVTQGDIARTIGVCDAYDWHAGAQEQAVAGAGANPAAGAGANGNAGGQSGGTPKSPGMKYRHYAPRAELTVYAGTRDAVANRIRSLVHEAKNAGKRVGVLATDETVWYYKEADAVQSLGAAVDSRRQAARLFECLREFDAANMDTVYAEAVTENGVGDAVMNRLFRAAGGRLERCTDRGECDGNNGSERRN